MSDRVISIGSRQVSRSDLVLLEAEPDSIEMDRRRTAVLVVDMQNAFVSKGGMSDLRGIDISRIQRIIDPIKRVNRAARQNGAKVLFIVTEYPSDLRRCGGPNSPNWYKGGMTTYREHPEWRDKLPLRGTWGAEIVEELSPQKEDTIIEKFRYTAFLETNLDAILRTHNIKYLLVAGVATNICVEATIRDAYYRDYFPILVLDAAANTGPEFMQEATIFNVKNYYGWVTTSENVVKAMHRPRSEPRDNRTVTS
jgi:ureidoacrylate peracid hydrolase